MLPARRTSKARKRKRRSHHALTYLNLANCPQCGQKRLPHAVCKNCGYLNPRVKIEIEELEEA